MSTAADPIVVIGSGAGGGAAAWALVQAGHEVVVVERGKRYSRNQFVHDELAIARRDFFVPSVNTDPHVVVDGHGAPERTSDGWVASCVGGGTVHMSGFFYRFSPVDFAVRKLLGDVQGSSVADWPISYEDLAPYYAEIEDLIGISGPELEPPTCPPRQGPYSQPALDTHPLGRRIDDACKNLGLQPFVTPRAIISRDLPGRGRCVYCQLCGSFGCESGAKSSSLETLLPRAEATGRCRILAEHRALRLESDGARVTGVRLRLPNGTEDTLKARAVVVAASTVETVRLLQLSETAAHPGGLGNTYGQLGKHLMFSTLSKGYGWFAYREMRQPAKPGGRPSDEQDHQHDELLRDHAPFVGRSLLDYYTPAAGGAAPKKAGALNFLFPSGGPIYQSEVVATRGGLRWGKELKTALRRYWHEGRELQCETFGEYLPTPGTYVDLDPEVRDAAGLPVARIHIDRHPHDLQVSRYLAERAAAVIEACGADEVWTGEVGGRTMHLPMGGCRMGADPAASVVDPSGRVHGVDNLWVSDGSVFPSSGGVPPTWTIFANALRIGRSAASLVAGAR